MMDQGHEIMDVVDGKSVRRYTDRFGRNWLASDGPWSLFRVDVDGVDELFDEDIH